MGPVSARLPDFPWDGLAAARERAESHDGGIVDLSIGTPVDPTPAVVQEALAAAADAPGYPTTHGTPAVREAFTRWFERTQGVTGLDPRDVLPVIGSKELIGGLPTQSGLSASDLVAYPELAYPTYEVGAALAGCETSASDSTLAFGPRTPALFYVNSPANPSGRILGADHLRKVVTWARERGVVVVSDECYIEFAWDAESPSILHPDVCGGSHEGLLAVHSLSKRSNLAGHRAGFVAGDRGLVAELLAVRKNLGLIVPAPVQAAAVAAWDDDVHVDEQRERYRRRRQILWSALESAGFTIDHSQGALYLWATRGEECRATVDWLAERGILVAPGDFYGPAGRQHVRVAFTATDERVEAAADRLSG